MNFAISSFSRGSSSLTISKKLCGACLPFTSVIEDLIFSFTVCFHLHRSPMINFTFNDFVCLANNSPFTINEVEALHELFKNLSSSIIDDGVIHKEELRLALLKTATGENLYLDRVFDLFDEKKNGVIEFEEFVGALSIFHPIIPLEDKTECLIAFRLYDLRQTGSTEPEELKQMVVATLQETGMQLPNEFLEAIIDKTFADADVDRDGKINKEEWKSFALRHPTILKNMTLPFLENITTVFRNFIFNTAVEDKDFGHHRVKRVKTTTNSSCIQIWHQAITDLILSLNSLLV